MLNIAGFNHSKKEISLVFFGIEKVISLIYFFDKKYKKKLVSISSIIASVNQAGLSKKFFFFSFVNSYLYTLLVCLRQIGFIFDFFFVPFQIFQHFLFWGQ
jgi:hypothetical protein